jgi:hypothetical protein
VINYQETRDTLNFGKNAGAIKNIVTVNEKEKSISEKNSVNLAKDNMEVFSKENSELKVKINFFHQTPMNNLLFLLKNLVEKSEEIHKEKDTAISTLKD